MLRYLAREADMNEEQLANFLKKCAEMSHSKSITPEVKKLAINSLSAGIAQGDAAQERAAKGK